MELWRVLLITKRCAIISQPWNNVLIFLKMHLFRTVNPWNNWAIHRANFRLWSWAVYLWNALRCPRHSVSGKVVFFILMVLAGLLENSGVQYKQW